MHDFAQIHYSSPKEIYEPRSIEELCIFLKKNKTPISIAGGKYSHGGQTMADDCIYLDTKFLNKIEGIYKTNSVLVEAGCNWRQLQEYLDDMNFSVAEMQSYSNFSIGGSISVNCHGRGMKYGTIADTILSLDVITSKGELIHCSPRKNKILFASIIGGYGAIAIIVRARLRIVSNILIKRCVLSYDFTEEGFNKMLLDAKQKDVIFFNCNLYPQNEKKLYSYLFYPYTGKNISNLPRLQDKRNFYPLHSIGEQLLRRSDFAKKIRGIFEPYFAFGSESISWRNYEMSLDVNQHKPLFKYPTTTVLQEYFLPLDKAYNFLEYLVLILFRYKVNILNLSIRYVKATNIPVLNYAPKDRISFVLYYNIFNSEESYNYTKIWTQDLIDFILIHKGAFYLPYLQLATKQQIEAMYDLEVFRIIKSEYDPDMLLTSQFIQNYITK